MSPEVNRMASTFVGEIERKRQEAERARAAEAAAKSPAPVAPEPATPEPAKVEPVAESVAVAPPTTEPHA